MAYESLMAGEQYDKAPYVPEVPLPPILLQLACAPDDPSSEHV